MASAKLIGKEGASDKIFGPSSDRANAVFITETHKFMHRLGQCVAHSYKACPSLRYTSRVIYLTKKRGRFFTTSRICLVKPDPAGGPKIRWYKQMYDGAFKRQRHAPGGIEDIEEEIPEVKQLRNKIEELDGEIEALSKGEQGSVIEPLLQDLSKEEQEKVHSELRKSSGEDKDQPPTEEELQIVEEAMMEVFPEDIMKDMRSTRNNALLGDLTEKLDLLPDEYLNIRRFNNDLGRAADRPSVETYRKQAWRSYIRCKDKNPTIMGLAPETAWDALWMTQVDACQDSPERAERLVILCTDMQSVGKELPYEKMLLFLKALMLKSRHTEALAYWQSQTRAVQQQQPNPIKFDLLGVYLFALTGNPRKAQQIALDILAESPGRAEGISHILVPVMEAWVRYGGSTGTRYAWAIYLHLRMQLGQNIKPEDFDKVAMAFLNVGRTDLALAVFKDLMLTGEETKYESTELYKTSIGLIGELHSSSINPAELTNVSLTALTVLPRRFQNKYFYGSWIKRLLGMGETSAAATVVELMYERGVKPAAIHLNGIIGAWLRSGKSDSERKAVQLGWAMIYEPLEIVNKRSEKTINTDAELQAAPGIPVPIHIKRTVCPATIETFSLLLLSYERRGMLQHVQLLRDYLPRAQIPPNTYFMNHLIYAELRHGRLENARKIYLSWSSTVSADLETFAALWDCEKAHLNRLSSIPSSSFPLPRQLLCEMVSWYSQLSSKRRDEVSNTFSKDLYDQIVRCFCLARDIEGTMVGLYALNESFGFSPDQDTTRMIVLQITSMGVSEPKAPGRRRARLSNNSQYKANVGRISRVLELLIKDREQILKDRGIQLDDAGHFQEHLYLVAELLRTILRRIIPDPVEMEKGIEKAAWEMGVSGVRMGDPHLSASARELSGA